LLKEKKKPYKIDDLILELLKNYSKEKISQIVNKIDKKFNEFESFKNKNNYRLSKERKKLIIELIDTRYKQICKLHDSYE